MGWILWVLVVLLWYIFLIENGCERGGTEWNLKGGTAGCQPSLITVDIGTEWNLKCPVLPEPAQVCLVDIGTEWNLKLGSISATSVVKSVDIGTEWNLKELGDETYTDAYA